MGKEIINVLQTFSGNATVRLLGVLVVLAFFMHKSKTFSGVWEFIANWWILLVFVSIETLLYFYGADVKIMDRFFRHREVPDSENFFKTRISA